MKTKNEKIILDTKKPLGNPTGLRIMLGSTLILSIGVETQVAPHIIANGNTAALLYPLAINIIPLIYPISKLVKLRLVNYKKYNALMKIVHSEQLIDYDTSRKETSTFNQKKVLYGVKIILEEISDGLRITFYPNGIKHSDKVKELGSRLEEAFKMNVLSVDSNLDYTTYVLRNVEHQKMGVTNNDF